MNYKSQKKAYIWATTFIVLIFSLFFFSINAYASDYIELIGKENGLEIIPINGTIFNELNMLPGDTLKRNIKVKNNSPYGFKLCLSIKPLDKIKDQGEVDLSKQIIMTICHKEKVLFKGTIRDLDREKSIYLVKLDSGEKKNLNIQLHLPGPETGNEFMNLTAKSQWVFTAKSDKPELIKEDPSLDPAGGDEQRGVNKEGEKDLPKTGSMLGEVYIIGGITLLTTGIILRRKIK